MKKKVQWNKIKNKWNFGAKIAVFFLLHVFIQIILEYSIIHVRIIKCQNVSKRQIKSDTPQKITSSTVVKYLSWNN